MLMYYVYLRRAYRWKSILPDKFYSNFFIYKYKFISLRTTKKKIKAMKEI